LFSTQTLIYRNLVLPGRSNLDSEFEAVARPFAVMTRSVD